MRISGGKIELVPAKKSDRKKIFEWLTQSDITKYIMGPPDYPEHPIPRWEEFCNDYTDSFFNNKGDGKGRNFIIKLNNEEIGTIGYDLLDKDKNNVVLDIWMCADKYCGHGYGTDAINALCDYIHKNYSINSFIISPSAKNKRAIAAYKKAGFVYISNISKGEQEKEFGKAEYKDNIIMKRIIKKR